MNAGELSTQVTFYAPIRDEVGRGDIADVGDSALFTLPCKVEYLNANEVIRRRAVGLESNVRITARLMSTIKSDMIVRWKDLAGDHEAVIKSRLPNVKDRSVILECREESNG